MGRSAMPGADYSKTEDALRALPDADGIVVFVTRADSHIYPVFVDFVVGDVASLMERLRFASPYPLKIVAAAHVGLWEFVKWKSALGRYSARRSGSWWARSDYLDDVISQIRANGFDEGELDTPVESDPPIHTHVPYSDNVAMLDPTNPVTQFVTAQCHEPA